MFHSFILLHSNAADKLIKFERIKTKGHKTHTTIIGIMVRKWKSTFTL